MKKNNPLVSIIIPVYNGEKYLEEAIESALKQTYDNIEIIVVNDGSKDNTDKIAKKFDKKIRYFKKENGGVSSALNMAIREMKGEFFSWLSHDDLYLPNKIEKQIEYFKKIKDNKTILYSDYLLINNLSNIIGLGKKNHTELESNPEYSLLTGAVNGITLLIPKIAFDEVGIFNESLKCTQDYDMWLRMQQHFRFVHMPCCLACTRLHENQDSNLNPLVVKEGNELWINMIDAFCINKENKLNHSEYSILDIARQTLKDTPYKEAISYIDKKQKKIREEIKKEINNKKVSVIIPFFNRPRLTVRAIKSVLNQSFNNIEIILVDDYSECNIDKIKKAIKDNKCIRYYKNTRNMGASASRNNGIIKATGDYIAFLDSDDEFLKTKIYDQLFSMLIYNSNASYTNYINVFKKEEKRINCYTIVDNEKNEFIDNCKLATPTIMLNTKFIKENKILYKTNYKICEDACFYLDILKKEKFLYIDKYLSKVYTNENSCINDFSKRKDGIFNLIDYVIHDSYYMSNNKEIENLFQGYINFSYMETVQKDKTSIFRKTFRKCLPLELRKKLKEKICKESN